MKAYCFKKIDAFTTGESPGNPAGCVSLAGPEEITEAQMHQMARELSGFVSEVGYVWPTPGHSWDFELRVFSREQEANFCGHVTVAIIHDLLGRDPNYKQRAIVKLKTRAGLLEVENRIQEENLVFIHAPAPQILETIIAPGEAIKALNLDEQALDLTCPIAFVNAGLKTLLIPLKTLSDCLECKPDYQTARRFCLDNGIEIITLFTFETSSPNANVRTRVFAPTFGYLEDPATGSGNAALGYHLAAIGRWDAAALRVEQGPSREAPNIVMLKKKGLRILIGGQSVCRLEGTYILV